MSENNSSNKPKSKNVEDYIKNIDEDISKDKAKKPLIIFGCGILTCGVMFGAAFGLFDKETEPSPFDEQRVEEVKDPSADLDISLKKGEKDKVDKSQLPRYTMQPSSEILNADPMSGMVQIGDYIFELPCELTAFTDAGFKIYALGTSENDKLENYTPDMADMTFSKRTRHTVIVQYDENSRYQLFTFDDGEVYVLDSTVTSVSQDMSQNYYDDLAIPMFLPGGIHCGSSGADCEAVFAGDPLKTYHSVGNGYYYNEGGKGLFPWNYNNYLHWWWNDKTDEVELAYISRNQYQ